jgi:hypothetical protein
MAENQELYTPAITKAVDELAAKKLKADSLYDKDFKAQLEQPKVNQEKLKSEKLKGLRQEICNNIESVYAFIKDGQNDYQAEFKFGQQSRTISFPKTNDAVSSIRLMLCYKNIEQSFWMNEQEMAALTGKPDSLNKKDFSDGLDALKANAMILKATFPSNENGERHKAESYIELWRLELYKKSDSENLNPDQKHELKILKERYKPARPGETLMADNSLNASDLGELAPPAASIKANAQLAVV